ncbi:hypothetical protein ABPG77_005274 [Micractinium sp. CCAP 211/92]
MIKVACMHPNDRQTAHTGWGTSACGWRRRRAGWQQVHSAKARAGRQQQGAVLPPAPTEQQELIRVLAVTDLHVDYGENMRWCEALPRSRSDVLVVSGDVSDELAALEAALGMLASKFGAVFYCPGNHELWVRERDRASGVLDSLTKLRRICELCTRLGVHTQPRQLGGLWVAPLLSWHHHSFDTEPDIPGVPPPSPWTVSDYSACKWPQSVPGGSRHGSLELAQWFDSMNDSPAWQRMLATRHGCDVVSFSHFLPHQALLPEKRYLYYPGLTKAVGSAPLAARLQQLQPDIHLFGHTHFAWDARLGGTRYIQAPLCSPLERRRRLFTVGFGSSMEAAQADPEGALWLPLVVYQGLVPAGTLEGLQAEAAAEAAAAAAVAAGGAGNAAAMPAVPEVQLQQQQPEEQQQQQQQAAPLAVLVDAGWQPLRHGVESPPLRAHWSDHYEETARQPEIVALAPWVADRWKRRRARAAARSGGESSSASGTDSSGSEPEDTS